MIRFGLRLAWPAAGRRVARLVVIAVAVALGVGLLLTTLAGVNAVNAQNARYAWLDSGTPAATEPGAVPSPIRCGGSLRDDYFDGREPSAGSTSPRPARTRRSRPGIPRLPRPGEYYASPGAARAAARHPGRPARRPLPRAARSATIGDAALPSPGLACSSSSAGTADELSRKQPMPTQVTSDRDDAPRATAPALPHRHRTPTAST